MSNKIKSIDVCAEVSKTSFLYAYLNSIGMMRRGYLTRTALFSTTFSCAHRALRKIKRQKIPLFYISAVLKSINNYLLATYKNTTCNTTYPVFYFSICTLPSVPDMKA